MTKENHNNNQDFVLQLLETFLAIEPKRIQEIKVFFSEAFLLHTTDEVFDDSMYREEWANLINWMNDLSKVTNQFTKHEAHQQMRDAIAAIKSRKEVSNV